MQDQIMESEKGSAYLGNNALIAHQTKNPFTRLSFLWVIKKPPKSHLSVIGVNERRAVAPAFHQKAICW
ncbi:hypothetical protein ABN326_09610 [Proteus mirabilis]|uniref:hypothetical protein n=1 Tax=Proteus mirabilis TaxID=584 RepID=UPI0032D9F232